MASFLWILEAFVALSEKVHISNFLKPVSVAFEKLVKGYSGLMEKDICLSVTPMGPDPPTPMDITPKNCHLWHNFFFFVAEKKCKVNSFRSEGDLCSVSSPIPESWETSARRQSCHPPMQLSPWPSRDWLAMQFHILLKKEKMMPKVCVLLQKTGFGRNQSYAKDDSRLSSEDHEFHERSRELQRWSWVEDRIDDAGITDRKWASDTGIAVCGKNFKKRDTYCWKTLKHWMKASPKTWLRKEMHLCVGEDFACDICGEDFAYDTCVYWWRFLYLCLFCMVSWAHGITTRMDSP